MFLEEKYNGGKVLSIFDLDDTIFISSAKTKVIDAKGRVIQRFGTEGRSKYKLKPGEQFDFSEYGSSKHFYDTATPIDKMLRRAKLLVRYQSKDSKTVIITARSDLDNKEVFLQKFRNHGFPIDDVHVHRAGNIIDLESPAAKVVFIKKYLKTGLYNKSRMWDDHSNNLDAFLSLKKTFPDIEFEAYKVNPDTGDTTRYS